MATALAIYRPAPRRAVAHRTTTAERAALRIGLALVDWSRRDRAVDRDELARRHDAALAREQHLTERETQRARGAVGLLP